MTHRTQITASIKKYMDKARELYPNADLPNPTISFKMKGGTRLGVARYGARTFEIRINDLISKKYLDDAINDTAPHEVAHLVAYKVHGRCQGHNHNWKRIMRQFGLTPNVKADASIDTLEFKIFKAKTEYVYTCGRADCEHKVGPKVHRKLMMGSTYTCQRTGTKLSDATYVRTDRKTAAQRKKEAYAKAGKPLPGAQGAKAPRAPQAQRQPMRQAARKAPASPKRATKGNKTTQAIALYKKYGENHSREFYINLFMRKLDMTKAGASTYYYTVTKSIRK